MADDLRYKRLTSAQSLALAGDYHSAYEILDGLLRKYPDDIEVHRLYGNVLELDAFTSDITNAMDARLRSARRHYTLILRNNNYDRQAMFDLAEHFANINKVSVAQCFYEKFLSRYGSEKSEEVEHAGEWLADI